MLMDQGKQDKALELLEGLVSEPYKRIGEDARSVREDESDTEVLVLSLLGILKKSLPGHLEEGHLLLEKAKHITTSNGRTPAYATFLERKKWLNIPLVSMWFST